MNSALIRVPLAWPLASLRWGSRCFWYVVGLGLLASCASSPESRIAERRAVFEALTAEQQADVRHGVIRKGFTADMVYVALGRPSQVEKISDGIPAEKWIYRDFYPSAYVTSEGLYRKPGERSRPNSRASLESVVGAAGGVTDASSGGGYVESSSAGSSNGVGPTTDVEAATMTVWLRYGKVFRFELR